VQGRGRTAAELASEVVAVYVEFLDDRCRRAEPFVQLSLDGVIHESDANVLVAAALTGGGVHFAEQVKRLTVRPRAWTRALRSLVRQKGLLRNQSGIFGRGCSSGSGSPRDPRLRGAGKLLPWSGRIRSTTGQTRERDEEQDAPAKKTQVHSYSRDKLLIEI